MICSSEILHEVVGIFAQAKENGGSFQKENTDCGYFANRWKTSRGRDFKHCSKTDQRVPHVRPAWQKRHILYYVMTRLLRNCASKRIRDRGDYRKYENVKTVEIMVCSKNYIKEKKERKREIFFRKKRGKRVIIYIINFYNIVGKDIQNANIIN